jgi:hypothetical protein
MGMNLDWRIASVQGRKAHAHIRDAICAGYIVMIRTRQGECMSAHRRFYVSAVPGVGKPAPRRWGILRVSQRRGRWGGAS